MSLLQLPDLEAAVVAAGLGAFWPRLAPYCRPGIRLQPQAGALQEPLPIGLSRLGGMPDLPAEIAWPTWEGRSLSFLGQINLANVAPYDAATPLPATGLLSFFYDALEQPWGYDPAHRGGAQVLYHEAASSLMPRPFPADLTAEEFTIFSASHLMFAPEMTLPDPWDEEIAIANEELTAEQLQAYSNLLLFGNGDGTSRLLGNPDRLQSPMRVECSLVTQGHKSSSAAANEQARQALGITDAHVSDWKLLLQLDSHEEEAGMMWGDMGRLYFWIKTTDLERQDFSQAWVILQSY
jgi:uncharacterized protein YwqG